MSHNDLYAEIRRRNRLTLGDLDRFVDDPASYEKERETLVRTIVRDHVALFTNDAASALQSVGNAASSQGHSSDLYDVYLRELRAIPRMERNEEFRYVLALEIARQTLERELNNPKPSKSEIAIFEEIITSQDATWLRLFEDVKKKPAQKRVAESVARERAARIAGRLQEMLEWKQVLVFRVLPLVPGMARKYKGMGVPLLDLVQEANASLMKATDSYEWRKGVRFVVYARWWVRQGVLKSLSCQSRTVRTPVYMAQKLKKIRDLNERAVNGTGERLSAEAIGAALDEPVERVERALAAAKMTVSIDNELDPTGEFTLRETLADPRTPQYDDAPSGPTLTNRIESALSSLSGRERMVLELRFGLQDHPSETLEEVSQRLGVSRERVRQIQEQALRKLQSPSRKLKLVEFLAE